jgi:hypothetical protein
LTLLNPAPTSRAAATQSQAQVLAPKSLLQLPGFGTPGIWTIELCSTKEPAHFHAWVQRDDAAPARPRAVHGFTGRQSYFLDGDGSHVDPRFTLNGIATGVHERLWVIGAMDENNCISPLSAAGPDRDVGDRCEGPDLVVTVDKSRNLPGSLVSGGLGSSRLRVTGTSMAAAMFTRLLYHSLATCGRRPLADLGAEPCLVPEAHPAGAPEYAPEIFRGLFRRIATEHRRMSTVDSAARSGPLPGVPHARLRGQPTAGRMNVIAGAETDASAGVEPAPCNSAGSASAQSTRHRRSRHRNNSMAPIVTREETT